ncbi:MAG: hypothetical protein ACK55I_09500, partial [bacterium]
HGRRYPRRLPSGARSQAPRFRRFNCAPAGPERAVALVSGVRPTFLWAHRRVQASSSGGRPCAQSLTALVYESGPERESGSADIPYRRMRFSPYPNSGSGR